MLVDVRDTKLDNPANRAMREIHWMTFLLALGTSQLCSIMYKPLRRVRSEYVIHRYSIQLALCKTGESYLAPPILGDVVEAVNHFREIGCLVQERLEVLHRVFLSEIL